MRRRQIIGFNPFVVYDVHAYTRTALIAAEVIQDGYRLLRRSPHLQLDTIDIAEGQIPLRWCKGDANPVELLVGFKLYGLQHGATPEAIRLLQGLVPINKQEESVMAEKLKVKGAKKADTEALKTAAKAAPVGKPTVDAPKKRGNTEALKKARESKGPDERKIKVLNKKHPAREGSFRATMLDDLLSSKTVAEFRAKNPKYDLGCLKHAIDAGYVSVS